MAKLKDFIATVKTEGLSRNNKFIVNFVLPNAFVGSLAAKYNAKLRNILLFCDSASLPGVNFLTNPNRTFGESREVPYEKIFDNVTLTFFVDNSLVVKDLFDEWSTIIQSNESRNFEYYDNYISNIQISILDNSGYPRYEMALIEAYPKLVSPIALDYANKDVMKLSVTFAFKNWSKKDYAAPNSSQSAGIFSSNLFSETGIIDKFKEGIQIPEGYFTDFSGFQDRILNTGETFENARNILFGDSEGIDTGLGERAKSTFNQAKTKLGTILGV